MLIQVHDELVFEIKDEQMPTVVPKLMDIMESVLEGRETHGVPITVEAKSGENWEQMEKIQNAKFKS
jgi:DNA polymerase-1